MSALHGYLGLGSNLGDRMANLRGAAARLESRGVFITGRSGIYESPSWGYASINRFYNAVIEVKWQGTPLELQFQADQIERDMWRIRKHNPPGKGYEDRTIDIDFLWFDGVESNHPNLTVPHPLAHQRAFVLVPWCELAPELLLRERTLRQWLATLPRQEVQAVTFVRSL
jgi:2-amino-4-hydroxy-6-hydroxymethyldihydropteridine diphosphokinase